MPRMWSAGARGGHLRPCPSPGRGNGHDDGFGGFAFGAFDAFGHFPVGESEAPEAEGPPLRACRCGGG
eukprot:12018723-Alexandrium_andersonii.AAC.1